MAVLSQLVGGGAQNYIEVYRLMNIGNYTSNWQKLNEGTIQPIIWNTIKNYNNLAEVSLANNRLTLPAGQYQYETDVQFYDAGGDANRAIMVGLSGSGDMYPNLLVPLRGTNSYSDSNSPVYTSQCVRTGQFTLNTSQSISMMAAVGYGAGWAVDLWVWCIQHYGANDVNRWAQSGTTQLSAQVGTLKLWKLR